MTSAPPMTTRATGQTQPNLLMPHGYGTGQRLRRLHKRTGDIASSANPHASLLALAPNSTSSVYQNNQIRAQANIQKSLSVLARAESTHG